MTRIHTVQAMDLNVGQTVQVESRQFTVGSVTYSPTFRLVTVSLQPMTGDTAVTLRFGADAEVRVVG